MTTFCKWTVLAAACVISLASGTVAKAELLGDLTVSNNSGECVRILVNGIYRGTVHQGQTVSIPVHDHQHATTILAVCEEDNDVVAKAHFHGHRHRHSYFFDVR